LLLDWVAALLCCHIGYSPGKTPFDYDRKSLKGGYICRICGKPILGKETQHTEEDCKAYRSRPKKPDHSVFHGAQKYVRMPDYAMVKEVKA